MANEYNNNDSDDEDEDNDEEGEEEREEREEIMAEERGEKYFALPRRNSAQTKAYPNIGKFKFIRQAFKKVYLS